MQWVGGVHLPLARHPLGTAPGRHHPPPGQYAFYLNAFLFPLVITEREAVEKEFPWLVQDATSEESVDQDKQSNIDGGEVGKTSKPEEQSKGWKDRIDYLTTVG